ncbi:hypothetical protein ACWEIJ_11560 [Lentzea sp. NPDC004789]
MSGQREGFISDILHKVEDLVTGGDHTEPKTPPQEDPPMTPQCCGPLPPGHPLVGEPRLVTEGAVEHDPDCPNHPDNLAKAEVAS